MSGPPADYIDVAERLVEFRETYPDGSLQQVGLQFLDFAGKSWVVYTAAAYRNPDDPRPGHGTAWEPVPGPTAFTRDSELQNAETSAWGRAMVAALAADTKRGVASANEVRNRQADTSTGEPHSEPDPSAVDTAIVDAMAAGLQVDADTVRAHAAKGPDWAEQAVRKLRERIDEHQKSSASGADRSGGDDGSEQPPSSPDPAWRRQCQAEGVDEVDVLMAVQADWPDNDQARYPGNRKALAQRIEESDDLAAQVTRIIDRLAEDKRKGAA